MIICHCIKNNESEVTGGFNYELNEYQVFSKVNCLMLGNSYIMEKLQDDLTLNPNMENLQCIHKSKEKEHNKTNTLPILELFMMLINALKKINKI